MKNLLLLIILLFLISCEKETILQQPGTTLTTQNLETVNVNGTNWMTHNLCLPVGNYKFYNNDVELANKYGLLYNSETIKSGKLIPHGYRLASNDDFKDLLTYFEKEGVQWQNHSKEIQDLLHIKLSGYMINCYSNCIAKITYFWTDYDKYVLFDKSNYLFIDNEIPNSQGYYFSVRLIKL